MELIEEYPLSPLRLGNSSSGARAVWWSADSSPSDTPHERHRSTLKPA